MPTVVTETPYRPVPTEGVRKRWTRQEFSALEALDPCEYERLELIEGELIRKTAKNPPHSNALVVIMSWLQRVFGWEYVYQEKPIDVAPEDDPTSQPEPDLVVVTRPYSEFWKAYPKPSDLRLVVEISDSTLGFDLTKKAALYARAGIVECWVLDIPARRLIVHRDPPEGRYQSIAFYTEQESVRPLASPDQEFRIGDAFPE